MQNYDLIVIGVGPAGVKGAALAARFGKNVAIIQKDVVPGGASVNTGTIPSKTLRESALHLSGFKQRGLYSFDVDIHKDISVNEFLEHKNVVCEKEWDMIEESFRWNGIERYRGTARFLSPHEIAVDSAENTITLHGEVILIATGSAPFLPPDIPFENPYIYDSDTILEIDRIPHTMAVIGAGVIGCEYASIFAALGIKVTLIDGRTELLSNIDRESVDVLLRQMRSRSHIDLVLGTQVEKVTPEDGRVTLQLSNGQTLQVGKVLVAAGRRSNTTELDLDKAGVKTGKRGILIVDEHYATNVPHIYGAGDVIGFPALASTSQEQARVAIVKAFELPYEDKLASLLPYGIYTIPEISMAGKTEEDCLKEGLDYEVGRAYYRNNARGQIIGDTSGMLKLIFDPDSHKIWGIHIVGTNASNLVHIGTMVMQLDGTIDMFVRTVFNHPTLGDLYKSAAEDGLQRLSRRTRQLEEIMHSADQFARRYAEHEEK